MRADFFLISPLEASAGATSRDFTSDATVTFTQLEPLPRSLESESSQSPATTGSRIQSPGSSCTNHHMLWAENALCFQGFSWLQAPSRSVPRANAGLLDSTTINAPNGAPTAPIGWFSQERVMAVHLDPGQGVKSEVAPAEPGKCSGLACPACPGLVTGRMSRETLRRTEKYASGPVPRCRGTVARWYDDLHDLATVSRT